MLSKYSDFVLRWRYLIMLLMIAATFVLAAGGKNLVFTNDYRYFFSESNPQLIEFETLQNTYTKNDNLYIMLDPKDGQVFNKKYLTALKELTEAAWQVPYSIRVDSITNFQHTYAEEDDLIVRDLVDNVEQLSLEKIDYIKGVALTEPLLVHRLISESADAAGVNITIELPGKNEIEEGPKVVDFTRQMISEFKKSHPDLDIFTSGIVVFNQAFPEAAQADGKLLLPIAFAVVILSLFVFLRSVSGTVSALVVIIMSVMMGMGAAGWLGFKLTPPSFSAIIMILTLAVADCVHFLSTFLQSMQRGHEKFPAIKESLRVNINPIFLTSITTVVGFLSLNFSDVPPFRDLGNITAMGVIFAFILSILFLPALVAVLPIKVKQQVDKKTKLMQVLANFVIKFRKQLLWGMGTLIIAFIAVVPRNEINDKFIEYFDESIEFRQHADYVTNKITGLYSMQYSLESRESGGVNEPEFLAIVEKFSKWNRHQPEVMHVNTVSDTIKRLNKNMHADDISRYKLPDNRELAAQYMLLYEMSLPYGLDLNDQINVDKSSTRISATLINMSTSGMLKLENKARLWLTENAPNIDVTISSPAVIFSHLAMRNVNSMIFGTLIALVIISIILIFALKSLKLGLVSLIPNLAPVGVAFGVWAIFDSEVGLALSVVAGMTLGIVVDDTVHFMSKYLRAKREKSLSATAAVRYAFENVGSALLVTTIVLAAGFLVLALSAFELNSAMGLLTALTIIIALIIDFLFLPPLLIALEGGGSEQENNDEEELDSDLVTAS